MSRFGPFRCVLAAVVCALALGPRASLAAGRHAAPAASGLTLSPTAGPPGALVNITAPAGTFQAGAVAVVNFQDATASYAGLPIGQGRTNGDGSLNLTVNMIAQAAGGPGRLFVTVNGFTRSQQFTIQPAITLNPSSGPRGSVVQVLGGGFTSNALITFTMAEATPAPGDQPLETDAMGLEPVIANQFGSFLAYVVIPRLPPSDALLTATDTTFTVTVPFLVTADFGSPTAPPTATIPTLSSGSVTASPTETGPAAVPTATPTAAPFPESGPTTAYFAEGYTGQASTNGQATFAEWLNLLNPGPMPANVTITYYIQGASTPTTVLRTVPAQAALRESVNADVGPDRLVAAQVTSPSRLDVTRTIERTSTAGARLDGSTARGVLGPARSWGFPEGYTGFTFQEYLTLLNPGSAPASVTITLAPQASSAVGAPVLHLSVPPNSRTTANITALNAANSAKSVGMLVSSDQPLVAERVIYFGDGSGSGKFGSTVSAGIAAPQTTQYFTGLSVSGGDQAYLTLLNPNSGGSPITGTISLLGPNGTGPAIIVTVAPGTRRTIVVGQAVGGAATGPITARLDWDSPMEAEAAQYFGGSPNSGAHPGFALPGVGQPGADILFSDLGATLPDGTPITRTVFLYNPSTAPVSVAATYFAVSGTPAQATYNVPPGGTTVVNVGAVSQGLPPGPLGAEFHLVAGAGGFVATAEGLSADGRYAVAEVGAPTS